MEDFSFKFEEIKDDNNYKRIIKIVLIIITFIVSLFIFIKVIKLIIHSDNVENPENVILIKSQGDSIKRIPEEKGGLNIENLDIGVYDVIDDQEKDEVEPTIKKTTQDILVKDNNQINTKNLGEQILLSDKIKEINQNDEEIIAINDIKNNTKITITTEQVQKANLDDLKKLGNNSLIKNLKNKKYIKPGIKVQLLAVKSRKTIESYWENLLSKYNALFKDKSYYIEKIDLNPTTSIYRLQVGMFATAEDADNFCQEYIKITNKNKVDCIVVK
ncbi:MAG TPA: SPOR domain-containing protein [Rickettsiales bacterium]|nr:SPOR domain-containing protein [Rickettsiales bacterium]